MGNSFDDFDITVHATTIGAIVVVVDGVLDLYSAPRLRDAVLDAVGPSAEVVVDLAATEFIDSSALAMIVAVDRDLRARSGRLVLVASDDPGTRALELTGISRTLPVVDSRTAALVLLERDQGAEPARRR